MTSLWAMRHGETEWNASGLLQGHGDAPLTPRGLRDVEEAARMLAGSGIARVVSSDLGRALRTAQIVATALALPASADPGWRELDVGALEGTAAAAVATAPGYRPSPDWRMPGGESLLHLRQRVLAALARILPDPLPVLVVTHGGPLRILIAEAAGLSPERLLEVAVPARAIVRFDVVAFRLSNYSITRT